MEIPEVDLQEMEEIKKRNFEERLKFIELYVKWLKEKGIVKIERVKD